MSVVLLLAALLTAACRDAGRALPIRDSTRAAAGTASSSPTASATPELADVPYDVAADHSCSAGNGWNGDACAPCADVGRAFDLQPRPGTPLAEGAGLCACHAIDAKLTAHFDRLRARVHYAGVPTDIIADADAVFRESQSHDAELETLAAKYDARPVTVAVRARQASVFDHAFTLMYDTVKVTFFTDQEAAVLRQLHGAARPDLQQKATDLELARARFWETRKGTQLDRLAESAVFRHTQAATLSRAWRTDAPARIESLRRLAFYTSVIGDEKMRRFATMVVDPSTQSSFVYEAGMFLRARPGELVTTADPRSTKARNALVYGDVELARATYQRILETASDDAAARLGVAECERALGLEAEALRDYDRVVLTSPTLPEAAYDRGAFLLNTVGLPGKDAVGQITEAIAELSRYRAARGRGDDIDELLLRARARRAEVSR